MANYCDCHLTITSKDTDFIQKTFSTIHPPSKPTGFIQQLKSLFKKKDKKMKQLGLLAFLSPEPRGLDKKESVQKWRLENWGCQHDAEIESCTILNPNEIYIKFATPWSPPIAALASSARRLDFCYKLSYFELGNALIGEADESQNTQYSFTFDKRPEEEGIPSSLIKRFDLHTLYLEYLQNPS